MGYEMKLDKIRFARLITHIQYWVSSGSMLSESDIEDVDNICQIEMPQPDVAYPSVSDINRLMALMAAGQHKIEAIRQYRILTGLGLKESKEQVEKYWVNKPVDMSANLGQEANYPKEATLGDILNTARKY
jgi:hypothetical protein